MKNEFIGTQFDEDCPATTEADWSGAFVCHNADELHTEVVRRTRGANKNPLKELVAIRYEADVLAKFRATGKGWQIGIDLGLKTTATCSNGDSFARQNCYRNLELKLGKAQRAKNKKRVKAIHAKIKNTRKNAIHKFTNKIVRENSLIVVGNVSSQKLAKTKMAKSVLDAGWFMLKTQLEYKSKRRKACL